MSDASGITFIAVCSDVARQYEREAANELYPARLRARYSIAAFAIRDAVKAMSELHDEWVSAPAGGHQGRNA